MGVRRGSTLFTEFAGVMRMGVDFDSNQVTQRIHTWLLSSGHIDAWSIYPIDNKLFP